MNKEDLKFKIDQLRKDKMIFALESCAISLGVMVTTIFLPTLAVEVFKLDETGFKNANLVLVSLSVGYLLFAVVGNTKRYIEIKKLEKKMYK